MSAFYGTVTGQAETSATRRGNYNSGIRASAQSWNGSVITSLLYREKENGEDELMINISLSDDSDSCFGTGYFYGTLDELKECFNMYKKYKNEI